MALEDILNAQREFVRGETAARAFQENSGNPAIIQNLYRMDNLTDAEQDALYDQTPYQVGSQVNQLKQESTQGLYQAVDGNLEIAVAHLPNEGIVDFSLGMPVSNTTKDNYGPVAKLHEKVYKIGSEIQQGNFNSYIEDVEERDKYAAAVFARKTQSNPNQVTNLAQSYLGRIRNAYEETWKNKEGNIEYGAVKKYIKENAETLDRNQKPTAYLAIGQSVRANANNAQIINLPRQQQIARAA